MVTDICHDSVKASCLSSNEVEMRLSGFSPGSSWAFKGGSMFFIPPLLQWRANSSNLRGHIKSPTSAKKGNFVVDHTSFYAEMVLAKFGV